jgi:hypothetical protein
MILPDLGRLQNPIDAGKRGAHTLFKDMVVHESHALLTDKGATITQVWPFKTARTKRSAFLRS